MLAGVLLLIAQPALAPPVAADTLTCPAATLTFAPPLDSGLVLTRRIERPLSDGVFTQTITYRVTFSRAGRGYRMRWQQAGLQSEGPPELLRLLSLQDDSAAGEVLDFTLDASGAVLGVSESPEAPERLARAIDRLRGDPALSDRPERERAAISAMLDRIANLPAEERAQVHIAKASRLLMYAGGACTGGQVSAADGSTARITAILGNRLILAESSNDSRADGTQISTSTTAVVALGTGLIEQHERRTTSRVAGTARTSVESLALETSPDTPKTQR